MIDKSITLNLAHNHLNDAIQSVGIHGKHVIDSIKARSLTSRNANAITDSDSSFRDRLTDSVARIDAFWPFMSVISGFLSFLVFWVFLNSVMLAKSNVEANPYPYIFLTLILSMAAAIQVPIIMMSRNRQGEKDPIAASFNYEVSLRAEVEVLALLKSDRS